MPERPVSGATPVCPDLETIGAFAEGKLDARERAAVEAHVAECEDCYELVTEVLRSEDVGAAEVIDDTTGESAPGVRPPVMRPIEHGRRKRPGFRAIVGGTSLLAAAAAVILVVWPPDWSRPGTGDDQPQLERLFAAAGAERSIEPRLSGAFAHRRLRQPVRSAADPETSNLSLLAVARELQADAEGDASPAASHRAGVASLLIGEYDRAITHLERAAAADPGNGRYLNDLSAAYSVRARRVGSHDDWQRALNAADRALASASVPLESRFNRAVALEGLVRPDDAQSAWRDYLEQDRNSGWAAEALRRLQQVP